MITQWLNVPESNVDWQRLPWWTSHSCSVCLGKKLRGHHLFYSIIQAASEHRIWNPVINLSTCWICPVWSFLHFLGCTYKINEQVFICFQTVAILKYTSLLHCINYASAVSFIGSEKPQWDAKGFVLTWVWITPGSPTTHKTSAVRLDLYYTWMDNKTYPEHLQLLRQHSHECRTWEGPNS